MVPLCQETPGLLRPGCEWPPDSQKRTCPRFSPRGIHKGLRPNCTKQAELLIKVPGYEAKGHCRVDGVGGSEETKRGSNSVIAGSGLGSLPDS